MKISNECELGSFSITEDCECEHCRTLAPFSVNWSDGGTWWCLSCARYDEGFEITEEFEQKLLGIQKAELIQYYRRQLVDAMKQTQIF